MPEKKGVLFIMIIAYVGMVIACVWFFLHELFMGGILSAIIAFALCAYPCGIGLVGLYEKTVLFVNNKINKDDE